MQLTVTEAHSAASFVENQWSPVSGGTASADLWKGIDRFKSLLAEADRAALRNNDVLPPAIVTDIESTLLECCRLFDVTLNQTPETDALGDRVRRDLLPYLLLTSAAERWYSKPRGYAGDFLAIEHIYQNQPAGHGRIGPVLDRCFLNLPAAIAVRNRRALLAEEINEVIAKKEGETARITSLACGPAAEIFDVFGNLENAASLVATLIDIDHQALSFVGDRRDSAGLRRQIKLINANLISLVTGQDQIDLRDQDLIYSIGLIDYFSDKFVIKLLNYIHAALRPGGKVILGNFHPRNPSRSMMEHLFDWRLIHRTEADMDRLFLSSAFGQSSSKIRFEEQGINLFAECIK
ncbi:MAG TPA: class I SAM-dependent methyltransferase family protein [Pyrinomonadaceae bacterium]|nr:class I SAM-dependent methyltransferase family protein [Pyrinomonadaceae bacterium]